MTVPSVHDAITPGTSSITSAATMSSYPSAYDCINPYSMPLCTIFEKWPAPTGPACTKPASPPGFNASNTGMRLSTAVLSPPAMSA